MRLRLFRVGELFGARERLFGRRAAGAPLLLRGQGDHGQRQHERNRESEALRIAH